MWHTKILIRMANDVFLTGSQKAEGLDIQGSTITFYTSNSDGDVDVSFINIFELINMYKRYAKQYGYLIFEDGDGYVTIFDSIDRKNLVSEFDAEIFIKSILLTYEFLEFRIADRKGSL